MTEMNPLSHGEASRVGSSYFVDDEIGRGVMGSVYAGRSVESGEPVAIKVLHARFSDNEAIVARFLQERNILRLVDHPNVVTVRDLVIQGDSLAIVMELVEGGDLKAALQAQRFKPEELIDLVARVASGIAAIHAAGIIHRDPKPANILLRPGPDGPIPTITDFGLARLLVGSEGPMTASVGTPLYMPPEIGSGSSDVGPWSDVYSIGAVLFEALTGAPPFDGSTNEVIAAHINVPAPTLGGVPDELSILVGEMLDKRPEARPSAAEVASRLATIASTLTGGDLKPVALPARDCGQGVSDGPVEVEGGPGPVDDGSPVGDTTVGGRFDDRSIVEDPVVDFGTDAAPDALDGQRPQVGGRGSSRVGSTVKRQRLSLVGVVGVLALLGLWFATSRSSPAELQSERSAAFPLGSLIAENGSGKDRSGDSVDDPLGDGAADDEGSPADGSARTGIGSQADEQVRFQPAALEDPDPDNGVAVEAGGTASVDGVANESAQGVESPNELDDKGEVPAAADGGGSDDAGESSDVEPASTIPGFGDGPATTSPPGDEVEGEDSSTTSGVVDEAADPQALPATTTAITTDYLPSTSLRGGGGVSTTSEGNGQPSTSTTFSAENVLTDPTIEVQDGEIVVAFTTPTCVQVHYFMGREEVDGFVEQGLAPPTASCQTNHRMSLPVLESGTYRIMVEVTTADALSQLLGPFSVDVVVDS